VIPWLVDLVGTTLAAVILFSILALAGLGALVFWGIRIIWQGWDRRPGPWK